MYDAAGQERLRRSFGLVQLFPGVSAFGMQCDGQVTQLHRCRSLDLQMKGAPPNAFCSRLVEEFASLKSRQNVEVERSLQESCRPPASRPVNQVVLVTRIGRHL